MGKNPKASKDAPPGETRDTLIVAGGILIGIARGGYQGIRNYRKAIAIAIKEDGFADYLPVGVPILALGGAMIGALVTGIFIIGLRHTEQNRNQRK